VIVASAAPGSASADWFGIRISRRKSGPRTTSAHCQTGTLPVPVTSKAWTRRDPGRGALAPIGLTPPE
jgi:hypothetical protein